MCHVSSSLLSINPYFDLQFFDLLTMLPLRNHDSDRLNFCNVKTITLEFTHTERRRPQKSNIQIIDMKNENFCINDR